MTVPVSVIIPTYNSGPLVVEAVASALGQSAPPAEVIVVDDGSTDDTADRLAEFGSRVRYVRKANGGVSSARNCGLREARSEYIAFLDADDAWHPRKLEVQVAVMDRHPEIGLLGTGTFDWPVADWPAVDAEPADVRRIPWQRLVVKNYFTTSSLVARREVLDRAGPFDTALQGPEDHDLWIRMAEVTKVANLPAPLTGYRNIAGSLSKHAGRMEAHMRHILQKLDARRAWRRRWLLRRKAYGYWAYSSAYMHGAIGDQGRGIIRVLRSMCSYPFPFRQDEVPTRLVRPKLALMLMLRMLRLAASDRTCLTPR